MSFQSRKRVDPHWYTPEDQLDLDEGEVPLRFKVRVLTSTEQADVLGRSGITGNTITFRDCFRIGCVEIDNCTKRNGRPCKNSASFMMMPDTLDYIIEVGAVIFDESFLTEEEKKTLSSE